MKSKFDIYLSFHNFLLFKNKLHSFGSAAYCRCTMLNLYNKKECIQKCVPTK